MQNGFYKGLIMQPYQDEIQVAIFGIIFQFLQGIADELGCNLGQLAFLNIFYELSRFCTSIVAQTSDNKDLYHARLEKLMHSVTIV